MPKECDLYPSESPTALFGFELRRHRKARGWSQLRLSKMVPYSVGTISMIETAQRSPSEEFARYCDEALEAEGALLRLWPMVSRTAAPIWFRPWLDVEATAEAIRAWEPLMIPGLFQTEDYARAILSGEPGAGPDHIEEQVTARMERQNILKRANSPMLWVVLDEGILHRPIGDAAMMSAQLNRLVELAQAPRITIQMLPFSAYSTPGLLGGFAIARTQGVPDTAYIESAGILGRVTERPEDVSALTFRYEGIRADALSQRESMKVIKEATQRWTS